jgi:spore coat polysaccharide biosynthesis protein SpsF
MKIIAIIQARMKSTRLPGKVLADIAGIPMLARIIARVTTTPDIAKVVIATTTGPEDDILASWVISNFGHHACFRGSENDVLDRYYQCANLYNADFIVRITADDPLKDASIIQKAINYFYTDPSLDYVSNTIIPTYPEGLDVEVFKFAALERAWQEACLPSEREHVTPYIWKNKSLFKIENFEYVRDLSNWRWTVDKPEDLYFINKLHELTIRDSAVNFEEIIRFLDENPDLMKINSMTIRNEGYLKSINEESI